MKTKQFRYFVTLVILFTFVSARSAFAHGDDPRVEISAEQLNPGAVLDLRGVDFDSESEVRLDLVGPQATVPFGSVLTDAEGIFLLTVVLPTDIGEGTYLVRATLADGHFVDSPPITVWGTADLGGGEDGPREEDDGLLAPMPTTAPAVSTAVAVPQQTSSTPERSAAESNPLLLWLIAGLGVVIAVGYLRIIKNRS